MASRIVRTEVDLRIWFQNLCAAVLGSRHTSIFGEPYTLAISEKQHFTHNECAESKLVFTHAEYKCDDGEFFIIEVGARGEGNRISSLVASFMSDQEAYDYLIGC